MGGVEQNVAMLNEILWPLNFDLTLYANVKVIRTILTLMDYRRQGLPQHQNSVMTIEFCPCPKFRPIFDLEL